MAFLAILDTYQALDAPSGKCGTMSPMSDSDQLIPDTEDRTPRPSTDEESSAQKHSPGPQDSATADEATFIGDSSPASSEETALESAPDLEGYEILGELGRGGMGVVYKAKDLKLDRTVALKMIIGGRFASDDDIQRFRIEAESAARLDHTGIVPIYDIGESEGNHFFSMKLIDGTSLSNDGDRFQSDPRGAARLMIQVSTAVQHAHERGVLHRDLKPANILLDEDGEPHVTDLGLAKRMDGESGLTQTGLAMGTPGFMAPEQAQGRKDITTAADVFSLGAILYWLQTGQAPFQRDTAMATLLATLEDEIPSLKATVPNADGDLDLICQKAMHRDPAQRYASAAAFANDLQAWLNGELLSVRAPTVIGVASVWIRKNLRTVLGAVSAGVACGAIVGGIVVLGRLRQATRRAESLESLGHDHISWVDSFSAIRHLSDAWQVLQFLVVPAVAICAFLNVLFVRPQSREANIVSGVTASLTAGVIAFLIGVGWQPMQVASIERGSDDIELLANAVWLETDLERDLAQQALMQRYPGLSEMDRGQRQKLLFTKIKHDQDVGILPGMWWGVGFAALFVVLPMLLTSILSGTAWLNGMRGWLWFGCTLERCVYVLIFFLIIAFWLMPTPPSLPLTLISMATMAFALFVAVKNTNWYWRVALCFTPIVCMTLIENDMATIKYCTSSAGLTANDKDMRKYAGLMNRLVSHSHDPFVHYKAGIAWLSIGEEEEYARHCRELLSSFENAFRPELASRLAKLSLFRLDLQDPTTRPTFHKLARFASSHETSDLKYWFFLTRAVSEQRQGNAEAALEWAKRSRDVETYSGYMIACTYAVDALAYLDLNDIDSARQAIQQGRGFCDRVRETSFGKDGHDVGWVDWRAFLIFEKEVNIRLAELEQTTHQTK